MSYPLFVISYNRPEYLRRTLEGLRASIAQSSDPNRDVWLFQDAAYSSYYNCLKTDPSLIEQCVSAFQNIFPNGELRLATANLGIARNIDAAERCAFVEHDNEAAIFFEDDLVAEPRYIEVLDVMIEQALRDERIGMVSAYGNNPVADVSQQERAKSSLGRMHHNWGFGLTRRHWRERERLVRPYLDAIASVDYSDRPYLRIYELWRARGYGPLVSNQDLFKNVATNELGRVRLSSATVNAIYIGEEGEHYTPELYKSIGFDRTVLFAHSSGPIMFDALTDEKYNKFIELDRTMLLSRKMPPSILVQSGVHLESDGVALPALQRENVSVFCPSGMSADGWMKARVSLALEGEELTSVEVLGFAPNGHIPDYAAVDVTMRDGGPASHEIALSGNDTIFLLRVSVEGRSDRRIILDINAPPMLSPHMRGISPDRRALVWRLTSICVETKTGRATFERGEVTSLLASTEQAIG